MNFRNLYAPFTLSRQVTAIPQPLHSFPTQKSPASPYGEAGSFPQFGSFLPFGGRFRCLRAAGQIPLSGRVRFTGNMRPSSRPVRVRWTSTGLSGSRPISIQPYPASIPPMSDHRLVGVPSVSVKYPAGVRQNHRPVSGFGIALGQVLRNGSSRRPRRRSMVFFTALKIFSYPVQRHRWPDSSLRSWSSV